MALIWINRANFICPLGWQLRDRIVATDLPRPSNRRAKDVVRALLKDGQNHVLRAAPAEYSALVSDFGHGGF